jgi:predicted RNase H-like HicB family nuclease
MPEKIYTVTCQWDAEAHVWYVAESDVPGLVTEAATVEEMESKLLRMIPELLELNEGLDPHRAIPFELIARKHELAQLA